MTSPLNAQGGIHNRIFFDRRLLNSSQLLGQRVTLIAVGVSGQDGLQVTSLKMNTGKVEVT